MGGAGGAGTRKLGKGGGYGNNVEEEVGEQGETEDGAGEGVWKQGLRDWERVEVVREDG